MHVSEHQDTVWRHRLSLLGGTTDLRDCAVALDAGLRRTGRVRGAAIERFEQAFAAAVGAGHGISFATGRIGLVAILHALGVGDGDEVLVPVPTHVVVPNAVRFTGATPVFVDCEPTSANIDLDDAGRRVTHRTKILLLQHTFGVPARIDAAVAFAARHRLVLVEDCVHALGATWNGRPVGSFGAASFHSTEETKMISTTLGGAVVTDDPQLADRIRRFQDSCAWPADGLVRRRMAKLVVYHALTWPPVHRASRMLYEGVGRRHPLPRPVSAEESEGGFPLENRERFSNAQARVGLRQLARLDENVAHRRRISAVYARELGPERTMSVPAAAAPSFVRYPLLATDRRAAERALRRFTVLGTWFTSTLEESDAPEVAGYEAGSCPVAERLGRHLINLPTHQRVTEAAAVAIAGAVRPWVMNPEELA